MTDNFDNKLYKVCELPYLSNLPTLRKYIGSLSWEFWKASYHARLAQKIENKLLDIPQDSLKFGDIDTYKDASVATAEIEATVYVLHASVDILAQVINQVILKGCIGKGDVSFGGVLQELKKDKRALSIVDKMEVFKRSKEFQYINAFCNTMKHRKLIDKQFFDSVGESRNVRGVRFLAFSYKENSFPQKYGYYITDFCRKVFERNIEVVIDAVEATYLLIFLSSTPYAK